MITTAPAVPLGLIENLPTTPSSSVPVNAGLSTDREMRFVSMRVQAVAGALAADVPWRNFFNGFIADRRGGQEWSLFIDEKYVCATIQTAIQRAVDPHLPEEAQVFVNATYSNAAGRARTDVDLLGIYDLPDPLGQFEANPHIPVEVSVPATNTVQIDVGVPDIQAFIWSLIPQWAKLFFRFGGPAGVFLGAVIGSWIPSIEEPDLPDEIVRTSPTNLRFTRRFTPPSIPNGLRTQFTMLLALPDGFALAGYFDVHAFSIGALDVTVRPFELHAPAIDCGGAGMSLVALFSEHPEAFELLTARVFIEYAGTLPVYVCGVTPINDPLGTFPASGVRQSETQANATITINPPVPSPAYYAAPYPCDLLVRTSAGVRLVRIPPPPPLTQEGVRRLRAEMLVKLGNCLQLVAPWWSFPHGYNPLWSVDPPDVMQTLHLWEVDINGLADGEMVSLVAAGQPLTIQRPHGDATKLSALITPAALSAGMPELSIMRGRPQLLRVTAHGGSDGQERDARHLHWDDHLDPEKPLPGVNRQGITVRQTLITRVGRIALGQQCRHVRAARLAGRLCAIVVMDDGAVAVDLTNPATPQPCAHWSMRGLRGAEPWEDGLVLFGAEGLLLIDADGNSEAVAPECHDREVLSVAVSRRELYVAHCDEVAVISRRFAQRSAVPIDDCRSVLRVASRLVVASADGITVLELPHHRPPSRGESHGRWVATELRAAPRHERGAFIALFEKGDARLLRLRDDDLKSAAEYPIRPWFLDAARIGSLLVRIVGQSLEIDRYSRSARL